MSRGFDFDSFGMDDFRESDSYDRGRETGAGRGGSSLSGASVRLELQRLREKETISDRRDSQAQPNRTGSPDRVAICRLDLTVNGPGIAAETECIHSEHRRSTRSTM